MGLKIYFSSIGNNANRGFLEQGAEQIIWTKEGGSGMRQEETI
jgi:hypothetical protein